MLEKIHRRSSVAITVLALVVLACGVLQPTATQPSPPTVAAPAATEVPSQAPTEAVQATEAPTSTEAPAGIEADPDFQALLTQMQSAGQIKSTEGTYAQLPDFSEQWAQLNWYQYWTVQEDVADFVFNGHFAWSTAGSTPEDSGCGIVFGLQSNGDHYAVFLSSSRILFLRAVSSQGNQSYEVGKTRGTGRVSFDMPAEADFALAVTGKKAYVYVDGKFIGEYTLSADQPTGGELDYTLLSGTNRDYGTKCEMTQARIMTFK